jgi:hypothetical protein
MNNFGWGSIYHDFDFISEDEKDGGRDHNSPLQQFEEQHLFIDWHQQFDKEYLKEIFQAMGLILRFSRTIQKMPSEVRIPILSRFYNVHVDDSRGITDFTVYFVSDPSPMYGYRKTTKGWTIVNTKMFDTKTVLRRKLYDHFGNTALHGTDNTVETHSNLEVLGMLGYYQYKYFENLKALFATLNGADQYALGYVLLTGDVHDHITTITIT